MMLLESYHLGNYHTRVGPTPLEHKIENDILLTSSEDVILMSARISPNDVLLTSSERRMNDERKFTLYLKIQYNLRND